MSLSTSVRLLVGVVTLSITARMLGPESFGQLMFWLSVAGLICVVNNFGLGTYVLREIGVDNSNALLVINKTLMAKLMLTAFVLLVSALVMLFLQNSSRVLFSLLLITMLAEGFTEFFFNGFRANDRFDVEVKISLFSALLYCGCVGGVAWGTHSVVWVAISYVFSRCIVLYITWRELSKVLGSVFPASYSDGSACLKSTRSYAADSAMGAMFGQIDSIVLNFFIGSVVVGVFQAGMRLFMAATQVASVLSNVFLPRSTAAYLSGGEKYNSEQLKLQFTFVGSGAAIGLVFAMAGNFIVDIFFGEKYSDLIILMPWFGFLFAIKFSTAAWGLQLTVLGHQRTRAIATAIHWIVIGIVALIAVPKLGAIGWLLSLILGAVILCLIYAISVAKVSNCDKRVIYLTLFVCVPFFIMLRFS